MQVTKATEIWVGVLTALGLIALFFVAMQVSNLGDLSSTKGSYLLKARFGNVGSLKVRAPVSMAGVTLGRVERISFDTDRYEALVEMRMDPRFAKLPEDTSASILTAGLLGEQYVGLSAGGSESYLKNGDEIELTQSAVVLEQLISRFLFNKAEEGKGNPAKASSQSPGPQEGALPVSGNTAVPSQSAIKSPSPAPQAAADPLVSDEKALQSRHSRDGKRGKGATASVAPSHRKTTHSSKKKGH